MAVEIPKRLAGALEVFKLTLLHRGADSVVCDNWDCAEHYFVASAMIASTRPGIVCTFASTAISRPLSRAASDVCGPMLTNCICGNFARNPGTSKRSQKLITVDELVNVTRSDRKSVV